MPALIANTFVACVLQAAHVNGLPPDVLAAVIIAERGDIGAASRNRNGSEDLGVMQINTSAWLQHVARAHAGGDASRAYTRLRDDSCYNVAVGGWILARAIESAHGDVWQGVGFYHSRTPRFAESYRQRVRRIHRRIASRRSAATTAQR
ncbi:lytic transglycosylase domain-containing protein [Chitinasiproducens palmae]|uniref:Transglycosylase SLT domain-containing protein n=1 Tax=Chitinasiproducens palmae TaxID=1770053 RepID=A0A1H2PJN8_9BURK|nr:lytic transglycosylase domain-containing protein [Chitinasiproducens palmae]SDV46554.1 Transglycosylase SLT domain-containing protein [Chitinasiproducens palmae]